jgi:hypothetical protein
MLVSAGDKQSGFVRILTAQWLRNCKQLFFTQSSHVECYFCPILTKLEFALQTVANNFKKIRPEGAEMFRWDGQTDGYYKAYVTFRNSAEVPKIVL